METFLSLPAKKTRKVPVSLICMCWHNIKPDICWLQNWRTCVPESTELQKSVITQTGIMSDPGVVYANRSWQGPFSLTPIRADLPHKGLWRDPVLTRVDENDLHEQCRWYPHWNWTEESMMTHPHQGSWSWTWANARFIFGIIIQQNTPSSYDDRVSYKKVAATYSPTWWGSTIGDGELNFSVRNGKRWILTAITATVCFWEKTTRKSQSVRTTFFPRQFMCHCLSG